MGKTARSKPPPLPSLKIRVIFDPENRIGPGKINLLEAIHACGSISEAGRRLSMSYHYAWDLVDELNRTFKRATIVGHVGGEKGGGAKLTPFGLTLVARYRKIERSVEVAVRGELNALQAELGRREYPTGKN